MLKPGSSGAYVVEWQNWLQSAGYHPGPPDGDFGPKTTAATRALQRKYSLEADGVVGSKTFQKAVEEGYPIQSDYPFICAKNFTPTEGRTITTVVIHSMEVPERFNVARIVATRFAATDKQVSAHFSIDDRDIIQCVLDKDVAYAAPGMNREGIHLEHAGYAKQTREEWLDPYSSAMLKLSAQLTAKLCTQYGIVPIWLSPEDLKEGKKGITSHHNVSLAFNKSNHTDPGNGYPIDHYLTLVIDALKNFP